MYKKERVRGGRTRHVVTTENGFEAKFFARRYAEVTVTYKGLFLGRFTVGGVTQRMVENLEAFLGAANEEQIEAAIEKRRNVLEGKILHHRKQVLEAEVAYTEFQSNVRRAGL